VPHAVCKMDLRIIVVCFIYRCKPCVGPYIRTSKSCNRHAPETGESQVEIERVLEGWQLKKAVSVGRNTHTHTHIYIFVCVCVCGPDSLVGIATELRAGRSGIESRWGRDFPLTQTCPGAHPISSTMGTGSFPGVKCGRGVLLTTHPLQVPRSWKSRAIPLPNLWATPGL